jgi:hypothetical protein
VILGRIMLGPTFFRIIEITFAAYMVPALLVPLAWIGGWLLKRRLAGAPPAHRVENQSRRLFWLFLVWLALFLAVLAGAPLSRAGNIAVALCWFAYVLTNGLIAWFLLSFTSAYGSIPAGRAADRVFLQFVGIVVAQPLMTAAAFSVLNNVMGVAWNAQIPALPAIQEGI